MPLQLVREREHLAAGLARVAAAAEVAVDDCAVITEVVGLREGTVAQLAGVGLGAVGQRVLL